MQDDAPELFGTVDLSYEVPDDNVFFHVRGQDNEWVAISSFPKALRPHGWLYLQVDRDVVARCRVKGIGFREKRWSQEPAGQTADLGPGPTLELRADSWERLKVDLGPAGDDALPGYRYLVTDDDSDAVRGATVAGLPADA